MPLVLGLAAGAHDSAAALLRDGEVVAAVSEERLTRVKGQGGFPRRAIAAVLAMAGASPRDVEAVGLDGDAGPGLGEAGFAAGARIEAFDHHRLHGTLAGHYSGHRECAVLTLDGAGTGPVHHAAALWCEGRLQRLHEGRGAQASAGGFYAAITGLLDFKPLRHEGKVLGLAAYGDGAGLPESLARALHVAADGGGLAGDFPDPGARTAWLAGVVRAHGRAEVSAAAQQVLEAAVTALARELLRQTGQVRLAVNGGVFANVKLNQRLAALPEVESLFVFPAMSNTGNAVGAGLLVEQRLGGGGARPAGQALRDVFWGPAADDGEIAAELARLNLPCEKLSEEELVERAASALNGGQVVGWFQGRMEFGPRALGHRSLLARATDPGIVRTLNARLERTDFMPFAPSVLAEHAADLFEGCGKAAHAAEFMTVTFDVREHWRPRMPAAVHVDGTARPQLVRREANPRYWRLIERYRQMSGIPALLNTSFNVHEEPIVCGPREALRALVEGRMDALAIGDCWVAARPGAGNRG
ncbi:MAG: hypothetical protein JNM82_04930 [Rhodocyclaceae bacterium]|nr:hypothetical protein [Rhodocyclaceae bacterium]